MDPYTSYAKPLIAPNHKTLEYTITNVRVLRVGSSIVQLLANEQTEQLVYHYNTHLLDKYHTSLYITIAIPLAPMISMSLIRLHLAER